MVCFYSGEEEGLSSDEDVPFRDDLNDQSYDPKAERYSFCDYRLV